jgi:peptidyl-prolyl cis-trans isomerase B (cyclophilin B)
VFVDRSLASRLVLLLALGLIAVGVGACGSSAKSSSSSTAAAGTKASAQTSTTSSSAAPAGCRSVSAPTPKGPQHVARPTLKLDAAKRYVVSMDTNCGTIEILLDVRHAPKTSSSFAYLVRNGFYNDLTFHRVAAGFVIQGGDPDGDGSGGPGYTVVERPPANIKYTLGTVAMAKTGTEPAGSSGSQFFIVTAEETSLPAQYALVGKVVGSLAAVQAISRIQTNPPQDGTPTSPVVIARATLAGS